MPDAARDRCRALASRARDRCRALASRARDRYREEGVAGVARGALRRLGVYRVYVFTGGEIAPVPEPGPSLELECGVLGPEEIPAYRELRPEQPHEELERRFRGGDRCFVARHEGRVVAATWSAVGSTRLDFVPCRIRMADDVAFTFDSYVAPALRGQRVASAVSDVRAIHMRALGYRRKLAVIEPENRAAFRRDRRRGNVEVASLSSLRLGPWRRVRLRSLTKGDDPVVELA